MTSLLRVDGQGQDASLKAELERTYIRGDSESRGIP